MDSGNEISIKYNIYGNEIKFDTIDDMGGAVASWLVSSTPDRAVRFRALARDIVLCSLARHLTLTAPLSV